MFLSMFCTLGLVMNPGVIGDLLSSKILSSDVSEYGELIECLKSITHSLVRRATIVVLEEEIRHIPWMNTFLKDLDKPIVIASNNENFSHLLVFYILFPEYRPENVQRFWNNPMKSNFLAVWLNITSSDSLQLLFQRFWERRYTNIVGLARLDNDPDWKLYSFSTYSENECGSVRIIVVDEWNKTSASFVQESNYHGSDVLNFHKCNLKVLCNHRPPDSIMKFNDEMMEWEVSGVSKKLLEIAEKYFNFSSSIQSANFGANLNHSWYYYAEELDFVSNTVNKEAVDFAIGWFSYSAIEMDNLISRGIELGTVTSIDCFGWIVPLRAGIKPPNSAYFTSEFESRTWILIIVVLCFVSLVLHRILRTSLSFAALIVVQTYLEQPIHTQSKFNKSSFRVFFSNFCFCSLVVSAAYKASFASFITVSFHGKDFSTVREIIESPLKWYGSPNMLRVLNATTSGTRVQTKKLLDAFNVLQPCHFEDVVKRVIERRDMAVFGVKRNLYYYSINEAKLLKMRIPFRFIPGCLIRPHTTHFLFKRGSFLIRPFNRLLNRLFETGIASYWILHLGSNRILPAERLKGKDLRVQFLRTPILALLVGFVVSFLVFVVEVNFYKIGKMKRKT